MKQLSLSRMVAVACILCASSAGASAAQNSKHGSDPARWYNGDSTQAQRMQVLKKELNAAYAQQTAACKKKSTSKRSACIKEARANFQRDSANARELVANPPQSEISERVVMITPAGSENGMQAGSTAVGGSAAGQTGAGSGLTGSTTGTGTGQSMGAQQSGASQTGTEQSGAAGYGSSQSMGATTPPIQGGVQPGVQSGMQNGVQSGTQSGYTSSGTQSGYTGSGAQSGYSSSGAGTTGAGTSQSGAPINGPTQSGSYNSNGSQSGTYNSDGAQSGTTQSMGAGTSATQSGTQGQEPAGAPPVQR